MHINIEELKDISKIVVDNFMNRFFKDLRLNIKNKGEYTTTDGNYRQKFLKCINVSKSYYTHDELPELIDDIHLFIQEQALKFNKYVLLFVGEFFREEYALNRHNNKLMYTYIDLNEIGTVLQNIALISDKLDNSTKVYINYNYLSKFIKFVNISIHLVNNIEYYYYCGNEENLKELYNVEKLMSKIEDKEIDDYFLKMKRYNGSKKLEEETIYHKPTLDFLESERILPKDIINKFNNALSEILGFDNIDLECFYFLLYTVFIVEDGLNELYINKFKNYRKKFAYGKRHIYISKNQLIDIISEYEVNFIDIFIESFKDKTDRKNFCIKDKVHKILEFFMFISEEKFLCYSTIRNNDLGCFVNTKESEDNFICFSIENLNYATLTFKGLSFNINLLKSKIVNINNRLDPLLEKNNLFDSIKKDMDIFFSYKIADLLRRHGYKIPLVQVKDKKSNIKCYENDTEQIIHVEIRKIGKLKFEDIDAIALDLKNKTIIHIDMKNIKTSMSYKEIKHNKIPKKKVESFLERAKIIEDNKEYILKELFGVENGVEYKLKNIIVTSRPIKNIVQENLISIDYEEFKANIHKLYEL